jgi:hypothetical protein
MYDLINRGDQASNKMRIRRGACNYNTQRVTHTMNHKHRVENKERLGLCGVENMGPRGSKCKFLKSKRK